MSDIFDKGTYERIFVNNFVNPAFRPRAIIELESKNKRQRFFSKLCHDYLKIFSGKFISEIDKKSSSGEQLLDIVKRRDKTAGQCYIMAYSRDDDRKLCGIKDGLGLLFSSSMAVIVSFNTNFAIFQPEIELRTPRRFVLFRPLAYHS